MLDWVRRELNAEQQQPFASRDKHALILASAGSGKTRTLVHLVVQDLADGVPPEGIVAFTFTEKAAGELLARIYQLCRERLPNVNLNGMFIGTIHAWCLDYLLSQNDFYNFEPIDELHTQVLVSRLYNDLRLEQVYGEPYPKAIERFLADLEVFYNDNLPLDKVPERIRPCIEKFINVLHMNKLITFGGMIRAAIEHLSKNGPVERLKAVYVDEYQDVNPAQIALLKAMVPSEAKVVAVGDDLQCIYNWRGSDVGRILAFGQEFSGAAIYRLSTNYRCRSGIVQLANQVAKRIAVKDSEKEMKVARHDPGFPVVYWVSLDSEEEQAEAIVRIVSKFATNGVPFNKIAILLRSVVKFGRPIVDALISAGIPVYCPVLSQGGPFINDFLIPVFDWLRRQPFEPKNQYEEVELELAAKELWESVRPWIRSENGEERFWDVINEWRTAIDEGRSDAYNIRGMLYRLLNECGVRISRTDSNLMVGLGIASQIIRSVEEIHRRNLRGYQRRSPRGVMTEVFYALEYHQQRFGESMPIDGNVNGVIVTTVHQAKGLEWPIVILPELVSRRFPVRRRGHGTSYPDTIAGRYGTTLEDERRLFYVAVTRAKERLFLLDPVRTNPSKRSRFLKELYDDGVAFPVSLDDIPDHVWRVDVLEMDRSSDRAPVRVGLSDILLHVECPFQFGLRRVAGIQPAVGDELGFGKGLHELIQRRFQSKSAWDRGELKKQVAQHVNLPYMSDAAEAKAREAIEERVLSLQSMGVFDTEVEPEVDVDVLLDGGVVHATIDCVEKSPEGSVRVRDWKSNLHQELLPRYTRQVQFYAYALSRLGRNVDSAEIVDVGSSCSKGRLVSHSVDISRSALERLVAELEAALAEIGEGRFDPQPSKSACSACDMAAICAERWPQ